MDSKRVDWVRDRTCQGLAVEPELFEQLLEDDGHAVLIQNYLDGGQLL